MIRRVAHAIDLRYDDPRPSVEGFFHTRTPPALLASESIIERRAHIRRSRTFVRTLVAAAASTSLVALAGKASVAQTAGPSATPSPTPRPVATPDIVPESRGGAGAERPRIPQQRTQFGHLPVVDIVPVFTQPLYYTSGPPRGKGQPSGNALANAGTGYDPLDIGGTVKVPITPGIAAFFDRTVGGTLDVPNARVTTARTPSGAQRYQYNSFTRDSVLTYRLDETLDRVTFEEGLVFRHRIVGGSNTSNNPLLPTINSTEAHYAYAGVSYVTPAIRPLLGSFVTVAINADTQAVDHHVACLPASLDGVAATCPAGNTRGTVDENPHANRVWETDQYVQLTIPVDAVHGFTAVAQDRWGALNFYENAPFPYRYATSQTYLLSKRLNRITALSLRWRDQWTLPLGAPYVKPNAQHNGSLDVIVDFHIDPNVRRR